MVAVVAAKAASEAAQPSGALLEEQPTWAQRVLQPASAGHLELQRCAEGGFPLVELPVLLQIAAELRFVPTVERHVEALPSILHRNLAGRPSAGPVHVAFTSVLPRLRQAVRANPAGFVEQFAPACAKVSNVLKGLVVVGLSQHPGVQALGECGMASGVPWYVTITGSLSTSSITPTMPHCSKIGLALQTSPWAAPTPSSATVASSATAEAE